MSIVNYDLDTSGGLMPEIRALIRPPDEDPSTQRPKKSQHPYYKRPGKGHNRDCCDACQEGGDLICCDKCPASFHLGCHDPPLEENDIPLGQWLCRECRAATGADLTIGKSTNNATAVSTGATPIPSTSGNGAPPKVETVEKKTRLLRTKRSLSGPNKKTDKDNGSASKAAKDRSASRDPEERESTSVAKEPEKPKELENSNPLDVLIKAARIMNPRQFELPREIRIPCTFPGTDREIQRGASTAAGAGAVTVDAAGLVPLPARVCAACGVSCRAGPLLQCDYCPLLYHLDCLDPPLAALPTARWMCPCHVQHHTDTLMLKSVSAVERVALWDRFTGPVDQQAIKMDFIRRAHKNRPQFRVKVQVAGGNGRVRVPEMVRHHYKPEHRVPLLPSRREFVRCMRVRNNAQSYEEPEDIECGDDSRKHIICMNLSCPKYMTKGGTCMHEDNGYNSAEEQETVAEEDLLIIQQATIVTHQPQATAILKRESIGEAEVPTLSKRLKIGQDFTESIKEISDEVVHDIGMSDSKEIKDALSAVDEQLKKLDPRFIKLLAFQRLQQILESEKGKQQTQARQPVKVSNATPLDRTVANLVMKNINKASLVKYGFKYVPLPSELLSLSDIQRINKVVVGTPKGSKNVPTPLIFQGPAEVPEAQVVPTSPGHSLSNVLVKATLCPVERPARYGLGDGLGRPVAMRLSRLSVGASSTCDVNLSAHGKCNYISDMHAVIFYDEVSHHFELINYSEFGTCVNGQLYSCDLTDRWASSSNSAPDQERDREAGVKEIANRRRGTLKPDHSARPRLPVSHRCGCGAPPCDSLIAGWEGAAILAHGAMLQFGCIMFVFSITDVVLNDKNRVVAAPVDFDTK